MKEIKNTPNSVSIMLFNLHHLANQLGHAVRLLKFLLDIHCIFPYEVFVFVWLDVFQFPVLNLT